MTVSRGRAYPTDAAAEYVGLAVSTVLDLHSKGKFPEAHKYGRKNIWFVDELDAFLKANVTGYDQHHTV